MENTTGVIITENIEESEHNTYRKKSYPTIMSKMDKR
jgi:hypothetical protein